jgi:hypothetical protein
LKPGDTFRIDAADVPDWLWVVVCRDDAIDEELIVGIVPRRNKGFDPTCEIPASCHDSLFFDSFVNYAQAKVLTPSRRAQVEDFFIDQGPIAEDWLLRIQIGFIDSDLAYSEHREMIFRLVTGIILDL